VPRAASASAFLRMAAFTWAERAHGSQLRGLAAKEMYAGRWAAGWNGVLANVAAGRATMPCRGALPDLPPPPSFSSLIARAYATRDEAPTSRVCLSRRRTRILGTHFGSPVARRAACFVAT
jgi:hypothetical protein